jgi:Na+/melibiose symporter-like transporter
VKKVAPLSRIAFAISGIPTVGIIYNGIDFFLFFFYSQIIGLSSALVGLALAIALAIDAVSDPVIGYLSDNWQSTLGRRHPFMYASIVPITALYVLVWFPPFAATEQWALFGYLLALCILLRLSMTMFDVPVRTLVAELTADYDERTRLGSLPITVSWITSSFMVIAMYKLWLDDSAEHVNGQLNLAGYQEAAIACGAVILVSLLLSSLGLHPEIPNLHKKTARQAIGVKAMFVSLSQLLQNRSMRALLLSGLFLAAGLGTTSALWIYQYSAFYGMNSEQMSALALVQLAATFGVIPVIRRFVIKGDKKVMAIRFIVASVAISIILPPLLILGLIPQRGSDGLFHLLLVYDFLSQLIWIVAAAILYSMFADVTDELLLQADKRLEGAIFAGQTFIDKSAGAFGALFAGSLLTLIAYPGATDTARVSEDALARLGLGYMMSWLVLASIGIWLISKYDITRATHAAEIATLAATKPGHD